MNRLPKEYCNLLFDRPVTSWDEAVPLGNGLIGALIWGEGDGLRFSLDRSDLWDTTPAPTVSEPCFTYAEMCRLKDERNIDEIRKKFDKTYQYTTPTKLPAGKIIFNFGKAKVVSSHLSLADAEAEIKLCRDGKEISVKSFIHAQKPVGFIKISETDGFDFSLDIPAFGREGDREEDKKDRDTFSNSLSRLKYKEAANGREGDIIWFVQPVKSGGGFGIAAGISKTNMTEMAYTVFFGGESELETAKNLVKSALKEGYDAAVKSHREWWNEYWEQSAVEIPYKMYEQQWYLTNYLFASCSRKGCNPTPLQGVWTADNGQLPPWKGDYHHDLNTQMSYYHFFKANHLPEGESFLDFLWDRAEVARKFAKSFYGTDGLCLPAVMAIDGTPLGGWPMYSLSPTNQLWLCQSFERYYRFTGDKKFLEERAYPYVSESMRCILGLLKENSRGFYELPFSSSPEIHDDEIESFVTPNSNYDLAMMRYAAAALIDMAAELNNGESAFWQAVLDKLPDLAVGENKVLRVSPDEDLQESHRHFSHAMSIHPLRLLDYEKETDKEIIDATIRNLELLGTGLWVGFSFTWMAEFYAIQKNGEGAAYQLKLFWENLCSQNGFHLNGDFKRRGISSFHYRPFTFESNICAADALQEMLLQTENGKIDIFPAIPEDFRKGRLSFEDLRGERGMLISAEMTDGVLNRVAVKAAKDGEYILILPDDSDLKIELEGCKKIAENRFSIMLSAGGSYEFLRG